MDKGIYRILDANFNRAREGLRVMEEYCRFILNKRNFSARVKRIRHSLAETGGMLRGQEMLGGRESTGDVGINLTVESQPGRSDAFDCFTASSKRASEAMRVIGEYGSTINKDISAFCEKIRFEIYTLEKDVALYAEPAGRFAGVSLYVLINADESTQTDYIRDMVCVCAAGGAECLQLRGKNITDKRLYELARVFVDQCRQSGVMSIINDRCDIAVALEADGVHFGQDDIPAEALKSIQKKPMIIGLSTHNTDELKGALSQNPSYVAAGTVFATPTKPDNVPSGIEYVRAALDYIKRHCPAMNVVAIGGINEDNIDKLLDTRVRCVAVSSAAGNVKDAEKRCRELAEKIAAVKTAGVE